MEKHAPDPRGQALVDYMVKGIMEAFDKAMPEAYPSERTAFEAAARERMAQVASTVTMGYQAIAEEAYNEAKDPAAPQQPNIKGILEVALGPVEL